VAIVAYKPAQDEPYEHKYTTTEEFYRPRNRRDPRGGCKNANEVYWEHYDVCYWVEQIEHTETLNGEAYYVVQNTLGELWGKSGYVYIAAEEGDGFQGLNRNVESLKVKDVEFF